MSQAIAEPHPSLGDEVVEGLGRCSLLHDLPQPIVRGLAEAGTLRAFRRGEAIWSRGDPRPMLAAVVSGRVQCSMTGHDDRQWVSAVVRSGGVCGLAACTDGGVATCNTQALENSRAVLVPGASVREAIELSPVFARAVARTLAAEVRRLLGTCEDVTLRTPVERLARLLVAQTSADGMVELRETQTQLASQIGTVREVVGRAFHRLEMQGIVVRNGRSVRLLKPLELRALAAGNVSGQR